MVTLAHGHDGALWIGYFQAGISRFAQGQLQLWPPASAGRRGAALQPGSRGPAVGGDQWRAAPVRWTTLAAHAGQRRAGAPCAVVHDERSVAAGSGHVQDHRHRRLADGDAGRKPQGEVWLADRVRCTSPLANAQGLLPDTEREARRLPALVAARLQFTTDGALWATMSPHGGVARVTFAGTQAVRMERSPRQAPTPIWQFDWVNLARTVAGHATIPLPAPFTGQPTPCCSPTTQAWVCTGSMASAVPARPVAAGRPSARTGLLIAGARCPWPAARLCRWPSAPDGATRIDTLDIARPVRRAGHCDTAASGAAAGGRRGRPGRTSGRGPFRSGAHRHGRCPGRHHRHGCRSERAPLAQRQPRPGQAGKRPARGPAQRPAGHAAPVRCDRWHARHRPAERADRHCRPGR